MGLSLLRKAFVGAGKNTFLGRVARPLLVLAAKNTYLQGRVEGDPPLQMNFQPIKITSNLFLIYFAVCFKI